MARLVSVFSMNNVGKECQHLGVLTLTAFGFVHIMKLLTLGFFASHSNCRLATCTACCTTGKLHSVSISVAQQQDGSCAGV